MSMSAMGFVYEVAYTHSVSIIEKLQSIKTTEQKTTEQKTTEKKIN